MQNPLLVHFFAQTSVFLVLPEIFIYRKHTQRKFAKNNLNRIQNSIANVLESMMLESIKWTIRSVMFRDAFREGGRFDHVTNYCY